MRERRCSKVLVGVAAYVTLCAQVSFSATVLYTENSNPPGLLTETVTPTHRNARYQTHIR